jgi:4-amino-4-deoxy-L-arabinose transferase-like glycosyltransferase
MNVSVFDDVSHAPHQPVTRGPILRTLFAFLKCIPLLAAMALFFWVGNRGIDFGQHWDESDDWDNIQRTFETGTLLPMAVKKYQVYFPQLSGGYYGYPSVLYWISLVSAAPEALHAVHNLPGHALDDFVYSQAYTLRVRRVCLGISSLSILWVSLLVLRWRGKWFDAWCGAWLMAGSWELLYHSRWVAPDALVMQFAALCALLCVMAIQARRRHLQWLIAAAITVGLAAGTKYPGALLILPTWTAALVCPSPRRLRWRAFVWCPVLGCIVVATFLLTTPGAVLQPWNFVRWVTFDRAHYASGGHFGYTVRDRWVHLHLVLEYLGLVLVSPYPFIAGAISTCAIVGAIAGFIRSWRVAAVMLIFLIVYIIYITSNVVMTVRNDLAVAPYIIVLAAVGMETIVQAAARWQWAQRAIMAGMVAMIAINISWQIRAANMIGPDFRDHGAMAAAARQFIASHPKIGFALSPDVAAVVGLASGEVNIVPATDPRRDLIMTYVRTPADLQEILRWPANVRTLTAMTFGQQEVNFNYYPTFPEDRLVVIDIAQARRVPVSSVERAVRVRDRIRASPVGFHLAAYLNCGGQSQDFENGITIRSLHGDAWKAPIVPWLFPSGITSAVTDPKEVQVEFTGLDSHRTYQMGWSWWSFNETPTLQSLEVRTDAGDSLTVQPPTSIPVFQWMRRWEPTPQSQHLVALPASLTDQGSFTVTVHGTANQPVSLSEIWLYEN